MYKEKLIALLEGLECQNISELIEKSPEHLGFIGCALARVFKKGQAQQQDAADKKNSILTTQNGCFKCGYLHSKNEPCR